MKTVAAHALAACTALAMSSAAAMPARLFYSGHSLLDEPLPRHLALIAGSLGAAPLQWRVHSPTGSSIRDRLAAGNAALPGAGFDTLVVTEQHTLVGNLVWNDSVGRLRHLHERFVAANPGGRSWFYAPWLPLGDRADPSRWIAYERAASPVWQCLAARVGGGMDFLPAGALLAALIERTLRGDLPGIGVTSLLHDDVHLTPLGSYAMALFVYATLFERSPQGASVPEDVDPAAARALQPLAWALVQAERAQRPVPAPAACRERLRRFVAPYAAYLRDAIDTPRVGRVRAWWRWARHRAQWHWALRDGWTG